MSWSTPPSASLRSTHAQDAAADALRAVGDELADALAAGTPVRSGRLRASWETTALPDGVRVEATAAYAAYVDIDTSAAERVLEGASAELGQHVDATIFGGP